MTAPTDTGAAAGRAHRWHEPHDYERLAGRLQAQNARLVARLHPDPAAVRTVYEIGCGTGALTEQLVRALPAARIDALDVSAPMLERARAKGLGDRVRLIHGAFPEDAPCSHVPYDAVFSNAALHWLHPRLPDAFSRIARLLAPGGVLCAASAGHSAAAEEFDRWVAERTAGLVPPDSDVPFGERRLTAAAAERLARAAGLEVTDVFLVERTLETTADRYASWWIASGGPWPRGAGQAPERAAERLTARFGGPGAALNAVHTSVVLTARRPARGPGREAAGAAVTGPEGDGL